MRYQIEKLVKLAEDPQGQQGVLNGEFQNFVLRF
jgi:U3 small nucleolar ribonucleoprotein protein LCP5